jgi:hypothetical protein
MAAFALACYQVPFAVLGEPVGFASILVIKANQL